MNSDKALCISADQWSSQNSLFCHDRTLIHPVFHILFQKEDNQKGNVRNDISYQELHEKLVFFPDYNTANASNLLEAEGHWTSHRLVLLLIDAIVKIYDILLADFHSNVMRTKTLSLQFTNSASKIYTKYCCLLLKV